ncbi:ubiquitin fusion degradation protein UFD1-domain-containing protein [Myxozyma melibiosi]|uniref:Ubiquitin fusion degradation protein UFD1-domain-containing protein n=1 Tax=Myxozyma melibiosi TaxID=54550 RepID=A0ABR1F6E7_9ASCO
MDSTYNNRTLLIPRVRPSLAFSDRIILPQSVLERLLDAAGRDPLPSPLTFRLTNPATNAATHCGVREFSAPDGTVYISQQLASSLGLSAKQLAEAAAVADSGEPWDLDAPPPSLIVSRHDLPKGTSVNLRPLDNDYLAIDDDWKALLESSLQSSYTTLTNGQMLSISHPATHATMSFLVDKLQPEDAVCIVDTDLSVDFEAISDDHARKSVAKRDAKRKADGGRSVEVVADSPEQPLTGAFLDAESLKDPFYFALKSWNKSKPLRFEIDVMKLQEDEEVDLDPRSADLYISVGDDSKPSSRFYEWSTIVEETNEITIFPTNSLLASAEQIQIAVESCASPLRFSLKITQQIAEDTNSVESTPAPDARECSNCHQFFPPRTFQLHSAFCERNNVLSACICGQEFSNSLSLVHHKTTTCPQKLHTCRFCHLRLPQEEASDSQSDLLAGYTGHESRCGTRTTECPRCGRSVRLRDVDSHMQLHEMQRVSTPMPAVCTNPLCVRVTEGDAVTATSNSLGLCPSCFGPLYSPMHDPTGARLKSRIERRYFIQLSTGCKKSLCENKQCATGRANLGMDKYAPGEVPAVVSELVQSGKLQFCVDDGMTRRRKLVDWIAEDREFARPWICKAVNEIGVSEGEESESEAAVRNWLAANGVRISEAR